MATKKQINNRKFLGDIRNQYDYISAEGAVCEEASTAGDIELEGVHNTFFVIVPDVLRRCMFLSSSEKDILWELFSWAGNDEGYCEVLQDIIATNCNMSVSTVKTALKSLLKKGFIIKRMASRRKNRYKIANLSKNPYVLLSEMLYNIIQNNYKKFDENNDLLFNVEENFDLALYKKEIVETIRRFTHDEELYMPVIKILLKPCDDFREVYTAAQEETYKIINEHFKKVQSEMLASKLYPKKNWW